MRFEGMAKDGNQLRLPFRGLKRAKLGYVASTGGALSGRVAGGGRFLGLKPQAESCGPFGAPNRVPVQKVRRSRPRM
jgi:hypothetical protein